MGVCVLKRQGSEGWERGERESRVGRAGVEGWIEGAEAGMEGLPCVYMEAAADKDLC